MLINTQISTRWLYFDFPLSVWLDSDQQNICPSRETRDLSKIVLKIHPCPFELPGWVSVCKDSPGFMSCRRTTQTRTLPLIARLVFRLTSYHQALWLSYIEQWLENGWVCPPGWGIRNMAPGLRTGESTLFCVRFLREQGNPGDW